MANAEEHRARTVEANGLRFHVVEAGEGAPVLLLHGFPDTSYLWRHQIAALAAAGYRAIAPDMRGRGKTDRPAAVADYALPLMVRDVAALLDALDVPRAHVVGHDWGAAVAWLVGSLLPERVDRLVAISVGHPAARGRPTLEELQKGWYRLLVLFPQAEELLRRDDWYLMRVLLQNAADAERYLADLAEPGALTAGLNWYRANLPAERLVSAPPTLPPISAPTLGIWSSGDLYLAEEAMVRSGQVVKGPWRYERIEDATHWIPLDQPERFNTLLLEFFA
jgi:pimeloyl-ACP methyl ester carboxylesterase